MNMAWISEKGASLIAFAFGLGFIGLAILYSRYRYLFFGIALFALLYGYRRFKKRETPFEKHERETRRMRL